MGTNLKYLFETDKFIKFQQTNLKTRPEDEDPDINEVNIATFNTGTMWGFSMSTKVMEWKIPFILLKPSQKGLIFNVFKLLFNKKKRKMYWQRVLFISYSGDDNDKIMSSCIFYRFIWKISSTVTEIHNLFPGKAE